MRKLLYCLHLLFAFSISMNAQNHDLIGYWQNWNDAAAPYIQLDQIDQRYSIVEVAFAVPVTGTDYQMHFTPDQVNPVQLKAQIQTLKAAGKKVIVSMGGATDPVSLDNIIEKDSFVVSMLRIIDDYDFDGIDIDFEGASVMTTGGTISTPVDQKIILLIDAIREIQLEYYNNHQKHLMLTMAPETAFVQGGQSSFGGIWGAYLPVIDALRDSLDVLSVQLYNSGSMYAIDGNIYNQGTADFIVAMTEAAIQGFNTTGGHFAGLPPEKVAVGLPACTGAAGGGFTDTATVASAIRYLTGTGPRPGNYTLTNPAGYPDLRGMMTWSINWDASCAANYSYAENYHHLFSTSTAITENLSPQTFIFPNPATDFINLPMSTGKIEIFNLFGECILISENQDRIDVTGLGKGLYFLKLQNGRRIIWEKI